MVTEKFAVPTITVKRRAASINRFSEDSRAAGYRELPVTEKSAVPTITGKTPSVNRSSDDSRVTGYRELQLQRNLLYPHLLARSQLQIQY